MTNGERLLCLANEDLYSFLMKMNESLKHNHLCVLEQFYDDNVEDCGDLDCDECIRRWLDKEEDNA
jgi:hypothetical protein